MIIILFILFLTPATISQPSSHPPPPPPGYAFIHLVQTWPRSYCYDISQTGQVVNKCKPTTLSDKFYTHGLWPANALGTSVRPPKCSTRSHIKRITETNLRQILTPDLIKDLRTFWAPITKSFSNLGFLAYEYNEHGICSEQVLTPKKYFERGADLSKKLDIYGYLIQAGIVPHPTNTYSLQAITTAIRNGLNNQQMSVDFQCSKNRSGTYLREVYLCLDQHAANYVSCPLLKTSCSQDIKF